ncbi:uncharacterized protein LOC141616961 [Silene latifolia]|uniref:uncharacterized protein LOC141616961 n=1 Tax=Silene latifolia TaxID=37657 RepID=UPI003D77E7C3
MALTMAEKSVTNFLFKRLPFNLLQTFKLSATLNPNSSPPSSTTAITTTKTSESSTKLKRKKKEKKKNKEEEEKTLFEIVNYLPKCGKGCHIARSHTPNVTYEITKINVAKCRTRGQVWGLAFTDGFPARFPNRIGKPRSRCWKLIKDPLKLAAPKPDESIEDPPKLEAPKPDESIPDPLKLEVPKPDAVQEA